MRERKWLAGLSKLVLLPTKKAGLLQGLSGKESTVNARDAGSIPRWARFPGKGMTTHSNMLAWEIQCTEEPDGLPVHGGRKNVTRD